MINLNKHNILQKILIKKGIIEDEYKTKYNKPDHTATFNFYDPTLSTIFGWDSDSTAYTYTSVCSSTTWD